MSEPEPDFNEDKDITEEAVVHALNDLANVKAYTLSPDELEAFKSAQYALRVISPEHDAVKSRKDLRELDYP